MKAIKTLLIIFNVLIGLTVIGQNFPTATQLADKMTVGWNLGNTLEATGGETNWGNALTTQRLIDSVKAVGFNTVRIPCSWNQYANPNNNQITAQWMARVKEVVDYCIKRELYVIINIHWDGGWLEENCTVAKQQENNVKQAAFWTQIATTFKNYDEHLLFGSANEPHVADATEMAVLISYHQTCINTVRGTGGNNTQRIIIVQGPATDIEKTNALMTKMPTDTSPGRLMAEVHFYPYQFTLMDADAGWGNQFYYWGACNHSTTDASHNPTWGEEAWVDEMFQLMKTQFVDKGFPVVLGEFGAKNRTNLTGSAYALHVQSREYFLKYVVKSAINHGIIPVYWCAGLGELFNRNTGAVLERGTVNAIMAGAYSSSGTVNCGTSDCKAVAKGHAYTNDCNTCVLGVDATCTNAVDCNSVVGGSAYKDDCGVCVGGTTGKQPNTTCVKDCSGKWGGTALVDNCTVCSGGTTGIVPNSTCPQPCSVLVNDTLLCVAGKPTLTIKETGSFTWYDKETGGTVLASGTSYSPTINSTQTYYVERILTQKNTFGEVDKTGTGWGDNTFSNEDKKIKITVTKEVTLSAVQVFTTVANTDVVIRISTSLGVQKGTGTVLKAPVGKVKVPLGIVLTPGEYVIDAVGTSDALFYQSEKGNFPYMVDGVVSFSYNASWATSWYGFFYNWEIVQGKSCIKTPLKVTVNPQDSICKITSEVEYSANQNQLYPNPFSNQITIQTEGGSSYFVFNAQGKLVLEGSCISGCSIGESLPNGLYQVMVSSSQGVHTTSVIKQ